MKKLSLSALALITLCAICFIACNSAGSGEAYNIKMRLNNGDSFNHDIKMNMQMNTAAMGQSIDMKMTMDAGIGFNVLNGSGENKELTMTYKKMQMGMNMGQMQQAANINTDSIMNEQTKKMVGKSVGITLSPKNEIINVKGFDSVANASEDPAVQEMMKKMFSKEELNSMMGMMFSMYPGKPVKVGDTWSNTASMNIANIDMKVKMNYKLIGVKNGLADIDVDGVIDGKGNMNQSGIKLEMAMSGTQKGTLTIKMDDGYLKNGAYKMDVKADMEMMGQKIPMTMKADYTLSGN
jgi:hypothetical protein